MASGEVKLLVLLTKADKLNRGRPQAAVQAATRLLAELSTDDADIGVTLFSALDGSGPRRRCDGALRLGASLDLHARAAAGLQTTT